MTNGALADLLNEDGLTGPLAGQQPQGAPRPPTALDLCRAENERLRGRVAELEELLGIEPKARQGETNDAI